MGMIDMSEGEADYLKYKFKQYLGSVSREIQNRRLKEQEMGMIIIKNYSMPHNCYACDLHNYHECDLTTESIEDDYCWNGDSREKHCPLREVEAIPKDQYEARLKAEKIAVLEELRAEFEEYEPKWVENEDHAVASCRTWEDFDDLVKQKIDALKGDQAAG